MVKRVSHALLSTLLLLLAVALTPLPAAAAGYDGTIALAANPVTTTANNPISVLTVTLSKPRPNGYVFTLFDDTATRTYCGASVVQTTWTFSVTPPTNKSRAYTGYMSAGTTCPDTPPANPEATSNTTSVTNIGYDGTIALAAGRILVDSQDPSASLTVTLSKPRPNGYALTVFDNTGTRVACLDTITQTTYSQTVTPPANQARTYTAYMAIGPCPSQPPQSPDRTAATTISSGTDNPARTDLSYVAAAVTSKMNSAEACLELSWSPTATHNAGSSLSDQQIACEAAVAQGKPLKEALARAQAAFNAAGAGTTWWLLHQATTTHPVTAPPTEPPDPTDEQGENRTGPADPAPENPDPVWRNDQLTQTLLDQNPASGMDRGQARIVASQCAWRASRAGQNAYEECSTKPIFASGNDVEAATVHDAEAIDTNPNWTLLNRGSSDHDGWRRTRCAALPNPALPDPTRFPSGRVQCDEYPFLSTDQGGPVTPTPHLKKIDGGQNEQQGWQLGSFYSYCGLEVGSSKPFLVIPLVAVSPEGGYTTLGIPTTSLCNLGYWS